MNAVATIADASSSANSPTPPSTTCPNCTTPLNLNERSLAHPLAFAYGLAQGECLRCTLEALELLPDAEGFGAGVDLDSLAYGNEDIAFALVDEAMA